MPVAIETSASPDAVTATARIGYIVENAPTPHAVPVIGDTVPGVHEIAQR